ncbi:piggyBac transposable element-derived protein 1-like [Homarus americanus]|uniref:piggyBac transposable element-derived protein 1-like n=1 Tax=Homarus americanus TaxID=6706 RepID=UPI001C44C422|nr:piggyBac transposable element-derived protein 1-like [Homarus americanus]
MAFYHSVKSFYSVHDAVNYAEENDSPSDENFIDIVEIPPPVNELTDEEDFDDEILDGENRDPTFILQDVPGSVELHRYDNEEEPTQPKGKRKKSSDFSWKKTEPNFSKFASPTTDGADDRMKSMKDKVLGKSPVEIFELFLDEDLLSEICRESVTYSTQKNVHDFSLSTNCLRNFIGILLFSGYLRLPSEGHYWSVSEDLETPIIRTTMPRNRFLSIKRFFHFVDNENAENYKDDKGFKIRPLADALNQKFKQFGIFSKRLSIDEQIKSYGDRRVETGIGRKDSQETLITTLHMGGTDKVVYALGSRHQCNPALSLRLSSPFQGPLCLPHMGKRLEMVS